MKISIVYNKLIPDYEDALSKAEQILIKKNVDFQSSELNKITQYGDLTFVIGGDGTLLRAAKECISPVMGINLGRLGFLSQSGIEKFEYTLEKVLNKEFRTEERIMLESGEFTALNDFVVKGCMQSRTSKFYLEINNKLVCDYIADGLIISTPTGSTAYGLSAGGPVLFPEQEAIVIVPICPHTLNARPLVIPSLETIAVKSSDNLLSVSVDGYDTKECVDKIIIKSSSKRAKLAFLKESSFYSVLRDKLHWGVSPEV